MMTSAALKPDPTTRMVSGELELEVGLGLGLGLGLGATPVTGANARRGSSMTGGGMRVSKMPDARTRFLQRMLCEPM
jgi:hypothetical protein